MNFISCGTLTTFFDNVCIVGKLDLPVIIVQSTASVLFDDNYPDGDNISGLDAFGNVSGELDMCYGVVE
ncbi:hypothetical protein CSA56_15950 [candidate division KSB3 bacterium]|uniref:Uncharacterized protein n=1 Tax=candidate division KSB3 bacterium TaxID=2044937 RepID=A0A2G6K9D3_9BACT|nr:MAG: hypothetical protein CSA56_15950 [candidate division KSB3 bacterium]